MEVALLRAEALEDAFVESTGSDVAPFALMVIYTERSPAPHRAGVIGVREESVLSICPAGVFASVSVSRMA